MVTLDPMFPSITPWCTLVSDGALGYQVVDVVGPVLNRRVANTSIFFTMISTTAECSESDW